MSEHLPAKYYQPGMPVIGEADGERLMGTVAPGHPSPIGDPDDVLVFWSGESNEDDPGHAGFLVPASLLRVWPRSHHAHLVARWKESGRD